MNSLGPIYRLPVEVITHLLSHCTAQTLVTVCCVNKDYLRLASNEELWKNLFPHLIDCETSIKNIYLEQAVSPGHLYGRIKQTLDKMEPGQQAKFSVIFPFWPKSHLEMYFKLPSYDIDEKCHPPQSLVKQCEYVEKSDHIFTNCVHDTKFSLHYNKTNLFNASYGSVNLDFCKVEQLVFERLDALESSGTKTPSNEKAHRLRRKKIKVTIRQELEPLG